MLYWEGARHPKIDVVGLHMRMIGHPARAAELERLLDSLLKPDVWIAPRLDIANHWIATHPRRDNHAPPAPTLRRWQSSARAR